VPRSYNKKADGSTAHSAAIIFSATLPLARTQMRRTGSSLKSLTTISMGSLDCEAFSSVSRREGLRSTARPQIPAEGSPPHLEPRGSEKKQPRIGDNLVKLEEANIQIGLLEARYHEILSIQRIWSVDATAKDDHNEATVRGACPAWLAEAEREKTKILSSIAAIEDQLIEGL